jgi:hypothetical protein
MMESKPATPAAEMPPPTGTPGVGDGAPHLADPRALQILSTEHWSLLAGRSLAYNEAFSRAGMFLSFLSATLIVIGFLVGSLGDSEIVLPVVVILLVADLVIGAATGGRLAAASTEELHAVRGMNRIRHAYVEMVPSVEPYLISSIHDDQAGVLSVYGGPQVNHNLLMDILHGISTTIGMVFTINAMLIGALVGVLAVGVGLSFAAGLALGLAGFVIGFAIFTMIGMRTALDIQSGMESRFPSPPKGTAPPR